MQTSLRPALRPTPRHQTVRAVRETDGRLKLLEPVELPDGVIVTLTLDVPLGRAREPRDAVGTWHMGPVKLPLTRDVIYGDEG